MFGLSKGNDRTVSTKGDGMIANEFINQKQEDMLNDLRAMRGDVLSVQDKAIAKYAFSCGLCASQGWQELIEKGMVQ